MVKVMISNVSVHNNPAKFLSNYTFEIKFECLEQLTQGKMIDVDGKTLTSRADLEFKLVYVGDAKEDKQDQVLDVVVIDAVAPGTYKFVFEVGPQRACEHIEIISSLARRPHHPTQRSFRTTATLTFPSYCYWRCIATKNSLESDTMYSPSTTIRSFARTRR